MNIEDLEPTIAKLNYRLGLLEANTPAASPTVKLMVAVKQTIDILQKWVDDKGPDCLNDENNPDYREVCSTLPMLKEAYAEYCEQPKEPVKPEWKRAEDAIVHKLVHVGLSNYDAQHADGTCCPKGPPGPKGPPSSIDERFIEHPGVSTRVQDSSVHSTEPRKPVIESLHGEAYCAITINGSTRKAVMSSQLTYESIIVSYDPHMASVDPKDWPVFRIEFLRRDSGQAGVVPVGQSLQVSPGMEITVYRAPKVEEENHLTGFKKGPRPVAVVAAEFGPLAPQIAKADKIAKSGPANFTLDRKPRQVPYQMMLGKALKELLPQDKANHAIYIENKEPNGPDTQVQDNTPYAVDGMDMYSVPPASFGSGKVVVSFLVNAQRYSMSFTEQPPLLSFEKIVAIADPAFYEKHKGNPAPLHTITYKHRVQPASTFKMSGSLVPGEAVEVTQGMLIDAVICSRA